MERLSAAQADLAARAALWQALQLRGEGQCRHARRPHPAHPSLRALPQGLPQPLETALEARYRLALLARADGNAARELALMREVFQADQLAPTLAPHAPAPRRPGGAGLGTAHGGRLPQGPARRAPGRQLKAKKAKLEEALKAYAVAADYGVAEVVTAAAFQSAALYQDFGRARLPRSGPRA